MIVLGFHSNGLLVAFNLDSVTMANGHLNVQKFVEISFRQKINRRKNVGIRIPKKILVTVE